MRALTFLVVIGAMVLFSPVNAAGGFLEIVLNNGAVFKVNQCWEEDNNFYFFLYGGKVGLSKNSISEIREVLAREDLLEVTTTADIQKLAGIIDESEMTDIEGQVLRPKYSWRGGIAKDIVETAGNVNFTIEGKLVTPAKDPDIESMTVKYTNRNSELITEKIIKPAKKEQGLFLVSDSISASLYPREVEISITRYVR